jgi:hypothetical protein
MKNEFESHIANKNLVHLHKKNDKASVSEDETLAVACFDLEEVLLTPKSFESSLYYKRRLNTFNFTVYDFGTKDAFCYIWNETTAGRGASEIASCVFNFIKRQSAEGKKKFIFFSDNCSSQNKNRYYIAMLWYCLNKFNLEFIKHKYLEKGHTYNENDSVHASIETASRHVRVYTTSQWSAIISMARSKKPYIVKEMSTDDFFDFKEISENLINFDLDSNREKVYVAKIRTLKISSNQPNEFKFKYDYRSNDFYTVNLLRRLRRSTELVTGASSLDLKVLRNNPIPLTYDKYNDLISLCLSGVIPKAHHVFYALLPHQTSI